MQHMIATLKKMRARLKIFANKPKQKMIGFNLIIFGGLFILSTNIVYASLENIPVLGKVLTFGKWVAYAALAVTAIGYLLWAAGHMFDFTLQKTVLDFTSLLVGEGAGGSLMSAIYTIWTASRDIANILIIGIFVYIAINKILGTSKDFKKMIVSLLSVAVLINFSFFFAQTAIDISNWSAVQVYNAISPEAAANDATDQTITLSKTIVHNMSGVAMGYKVWQEASKSFNKWDWKTYASFIPNVIVVSILTLITAILFFRMAFILIARWVVLVILMATSSLAFAAMLIPSLKSYWESWYKGLIYNAIVAPLLLLLLWAATLLMIGVSSAFNLFGDKFKVDMNKMATDPGLATAFAEGLIGFAIMIGLLWAAIHIATMLSNKAAKEAGGLGSIISKGLGHIEGFGYGKMLSGAGSFGRNTYGAGFSSMGKALETKAMNSRNSIMKNLYGDLSKFAKKQGNRGLDPRSNKFIKDFADSAGISMGKANIEGFQKYKDRREKEQKALDEKYNKSIEEQAIKAGEQQAEISRGLVAQQKEKETLQKELNKEISKLSESQESLSESIKNDETKHEEMTGKKEILEGQIKAAKDIAARTDGKKVDITDATEMQRAVDQQDALIQRISADIAEGERAGTRPNQLAKYKQALKREQSYMSDLKKAQELQREHGDITMAEMQLDNLGAQLTTNQRKIIRNKAEENNLKEEIIEKRRLLKQLKSDALTLQSQQENVDAEILKTANSFAEKLTAVREVGTKSKDHDEKVAQLMAQRTKLHQKMQNSKHATPADIAVNKAKMDKLDKELAELIKKDSILAGNSSKLAQRIRQTPGERKKADTTNELSKKFQKWMDKQETGSGAQAQSKTQSRTAQADAQSNKAAAAGGAVSSSS